MTSWESVCLMIDRSGESRLKRDFLKKKFRKIWQDGRLEQVLDPYWKYRLVCARLYLGDYSDYSGFEWRAENGWSSDLYYKEYETPKWGGGYVNRLIVMGEQGIGDQLMFASILPECLIRVKEVIYECDQRLHDLLHRSLGVRCRDLRETGISTDGDAYIPAAELMRMFRRDKRHFPGKPYLKPDPGIKSRLAEFSGRVGISWKGRQGSIDPSRIADFGSDLHQPPVNLQYDFRDPRCAETGIDLKNDIEGVVALCSVLSKVVCVPTSVLHFAGAVGTKVEVIEPEIEGEVENQIRWDCPPGKSVWYRDVYCFRSVKEWSLTKHTSSENRNTERSMSMENS
jgi:hypothetical protein